MILILIILASFMELSQADCRSKRTFVLANASSNVAPRHFQSVSNVGDEMQCSVLCRRYPVECFGFYYQSEIRICCLFNYSSFVERTFWLSVEKVPRNIYSSVFGNQDNVLTMISCQQSSTADDAVCSRAIDGNFNRSFASNSCTLTTGLNGSDWWEAALAETARVTLVRIENRQDCCADRLNNFSVFVDDKECLRIDRTTSFDFLILNCQAVGSRIRLVSRRLEPFSLCEFQAFGNTLI